MKPNLYYVGILATIFMMLSGPASFATPTNQTQLTDMTEQEEISSEEDAFVSIGEGSNATVQYYTYTPQIVEINAGQTVTWFAPDEAVDFHTVTFASDLSSFPQLILPFAVGPGGSTNFELLPQFSLGEPVIIPAPDGREAIVALNKHAWYPTVVDTNNQTTYLEGTDIQVTINSTVRALNSGIILPVLPPAEGGEVSSNETGIAGELQVTPEISPTSLTTETTNATGNTTDVLTLPDDRGTPQSPEGATEEPLGPPFPPVSSFTVMFEEPGIYPYICVIHPWMGGQVIVRGDAQNETGTQPLGNETGTTATTTPNATTADSQPPAAEIETGTQPLGNETGTTADTQGMPLSDPDAETPTPTPPSAGSESPNPVFG
jgi:plastocyanin